MFKKVKTAWFITALWVTNVLPLYWGWLFSHGQSRSDRTSLTKGFILTRYWFITGCRHGVLILCISYSSFFWMTLTWQTQYYRPDFIQDGSSSPMDGQYMLTLPATFIFLKMNKNKCCLNFISNLLFRSGNKHAILLK